LCSPRNRFLLGVSSDHQQPAFPRGLTLGISLRELTQVMEKELLIRLGTLHLGRSIWDAPSGTLHLGRFTCRPGLSLARACQFRWRRAFRPYPGIVSPD
jgi:hypothetical protein